MSEQKLKAAFLYNFTKFVEWPSGRFTTGSDPIVIGLLADTAMEIELRAIVANRLVNGRAVNVLPITSAREFSSAHMVFVSPLQHARFEALRGQAHSVALLTVGDNPSCRSRGGGICFTQQGEKLRFEINIDTVERSQLKISAQLQKLALAVNKGDGA